MEGRSGVSWMEQGACKEVSKYFYPPAGKETPTMRQEREEKAKRVCGTCAVKAACLDYALSRPEKEGVWGGTTPEERGFGSRKRIS